MDGNGIKSNPETQYMRMYPYGIPARYKFVKHRCMVKPIRARPANIPREKLRAFNDTPRARMRKASR